MIVISLVIKSCLTVGTPSHVAQIATPARNTRHLECVVGGFIFGVSLHFVCFGFVELSAFNLVVALGDVVVAFDRGKTFQLVLLCPFALFLDALATHERVRLREMVAMLVGAWSVRVVPAQVRNMAMSAALEGEAFRDVGAVVDDAREATTAVKFGHILVSPPDRLEVAKERRVAGLVTRVRCLLAPHADVHLRGNRCNQRHVRRDRGLDHVEGKKVEL